VKGALDTHYHYDHSMGNAFFGANGIPLWAHANTAKRIVENYGAMQGADKAVFLSPLEKTIKEAKTETGAKTPRRLSCPCNECIQRFKFQYSCPSKSSD